MSEADLTTVLEELTDGDFKKFKWHLKKEKVEGRGTISVAKLEKADREEAVDLMVGNYELDLAVQVMKTVLERICRNDLVRMLGEKIPGQ